MGVEIFKHLKGASIELSLPQPGSWGKSSAPLKCSKGWTTHIRARIIQKESNPINMQDY